MEERQNEFRIERDRERNYDQIRTFEPSISLPWLEVVCFFPPHLFIRTGSGNEWQFDAIERAARYDDCNRSDAVAYACEDVGGIVAGARRVLERDDLTTR